MFNLLDIAIGVAIGVGVIFLGHFVWTKVKQGYSAVATSASTAVHGRTNALEADVAAIKADIAAVKAKVGI